MQPAENSPELSSLYQFLAGNGYTRGFPAVQSHCGSTEVVEFSDHHRKAEGRAFAASENHKEAERRRRERINGHLDKLRALLLCNSKTDKASLLAKVVERVRELKQQTSEIMQLYDQTLIPSESDEIAVMQSHDSINGKTIVRASLCCEDRVDLIPDLIEVLKPLGLRPLRAEMVTLGGRIKNVIHVLGGDDDDDDQNQTTTTTVDETTSCLKDALETMVFRSSGASCVGGERSKRRRMFDHQRIMG
ncbi:Transcription factor [Sesamum alatum]|uniref:Transcription factor n=1 Tax=Sesamum alatum TaxID=300844 RepID=A0AAE1XIX8_9LAMI|nr:Transcription factor [Sesamum alatum]